ncbi:MAG: TonB family protein [Gammaproteobacteria bacterium]|nr:MAG: TonB family protein [Gammaproteobacteria bacterium]
MSVQAVTLPTTGAKADAAGLMRSFGVASLVVLLGVAAAWFYVKRVGDAPVLFEDDMLFVETVERRRRSGVELLIEQGELAYAAGRILEPQFDSALYFYQAVLAEDAQHRDARLGLDRVIDWLRGELAAARAAEDLQREVAVTARIAELRPGDERAAREALIARRKLASWGQFEAALASGDISEAGAQYRELRALRGADAVADAGMERVVSTLVTQARIAANQGDVERAQSALDEAVEWGIDFETETSLNAIITEARTPVRDGAFEATLTAAVGALEEGRLMGGDDSAWELFQAVLREHPDHSGAHGGILEVRAALGARTREAIAAEQFDTIPQLLEDARRAGVSEDQRSALRRELEYREHVAAMRLGRYGEPFRVSDLEVITERAPVYPRAAMTRQIEGWVDLEFTVSAAGRVEDVHVRESSASVFHQTSIDAVEGYQFAPYLLHGRPVPVRAALRFNYRM